MNRITMVILVSLLSIQLQAQHWRLVADSISVEPFLAEDIKPATYFDPKTRGLIMLASIPGGAIIGGGLGYILPAIPNGKITGVENIYGALFGIFVGGLAGPFIVPPIVGLKYNTYLPLTLFDEVPKILANTSPIYSNNVYEQLKDKDLKLKAFMDNTGSIRKIEFLNDSELKTLDSKFKKMMKARVQSAEFSPAMHEGKPVHGGVIVHLKWELVERTKRTSTPKD